MKILHIYTHVFQHYRSGFITKCFQYYTSLLSVQEAKKFSLVHQPQDHGTHSGCSSFGRCPFVKLTVNLELNAYWLLCVLSYKICYFSEDL